MSWMNLLSLLGGLALFLYGMDLLGASLEKRAGNRLKSILTRLTSNALNGFLLGAGVTAVIQSSSATTVMVVGFVNSGLMTLRQSIPLIIGANVGTAVTSWILSLAGIEGDAWYISMLKPANFTPIIAFWGIVRFMSAKHQKRRDTACIALGFAILMFGMEMMSGAVQPLADMPEFTRILVMFSSPILGVLAGTALTAIIQSSSASVGILQALSLTGAVTYASAIPIILGQNIGTCVTAMIASIGVTRDAKRASMIHLYFNVIGTTVWLAAFYAADAFFHFAFTPMQATPLGIAIVHTVFKLLCTLLLMPFSAQLEKLARLTIPDGREVSAPLLDERLFITPAIALEQAHNVLLDMASLASQNLNSALDLIAGFDPKAAQSILEKKARVDSFEDKLRIYLVKLGSHNMCESDNRELTKYLHILEDYVCISDHTADIVSCAREKSDKHLRFSDEAWQEIYTMMCAVREMLNLALTALREIDFDSAIQAEPLKQVIGQLHSRIKRRHIHRLTHGSCTIELGFILSDLLASLESVSDHCSNVAVCIIEIANSDLEAHEYLRDRACSVEFKRMYEDFQSTYALKPAISKSAGE